MRATIASASDVSVLSSVRTLARRTSHTLTIHGGSFAAAVAFKGGRRGARRSRITPASPEHIHDLNSVTFYNSRTLAEATLVPSPSSRPEAAA